MEQIPISEARARLGELADRVRYTGEPVLLTKNGKERVALVPDYVAEQWQEMRARDFRVLAEIWELNPGINMTEEEIMAWSVGAVREVRLEMAAERAAQRATERAAGNAPSTNGEVD